LEEQRKRVLSSRIRKDGEFTI